MTGTEPVPGAGPGAGIEPGTGATPSTGTDRGDPDCELCEAARMTEWFHEDDVCWIADCEVCSVPMVVWKRHGAEPPADEVEHMLARLAVVADERLGAGVWSFDRVMRQIPDHFHAHARDPDWWYRRMGR